MNQLLLLGLGNTAQILTLGLALTSSPTVEVDTHDGVDKRPIAELGTPYEVKAKTQESVRETLLRVMAPPVVVEKVTPRPVEIVFDAPEPVAFFDEEDETISLMLLS